jgi:tetratricopeptide (TPR) repeat protein
MPHKARPDFDAYLAKDSSDARALINRAATRFPNDLAGVVADCNQALRIDPDNKNGYFLRGLARYDLGEKQEACEDFERAIALGFSILRMAEQERCGGYWDVPNSNP